MLENNNQIPKYDLDNKYQDSDGLSTKRLDMGFWYVEHRRALRLSLIIFLIIISGLSWSLSLYTYADYIFKGMKEDEAIVNSLSLAEGIDHAYVLSKAPVDLSYFPVNVLKSGQGRYDLIAEISNSNKKHWGEFEYYFLLNGKETATMKSFILPEEKTYVMALGQESDYEPYGVQLIIKNTVWRVIDGHKFPDWQDFKNKHSDIAVSDIEIMPGGMSGLSDKINLGHLKFKVTNRTAFNYDNAEFVMLLYSGPNLSAANNYTLSRLMSGETRSLDMGWQNLPESANEALIIPRVNFMLDSAFLKF